MIAELRKNIKKKVNLLGELNQVILCKSSTGKIAINSSKEPSNPVLNISNRGSHYKKAF
jgi:hypothetical protein